MMLFSTIDGVIKEVDVLIAGGMLYIIHYSSTP